jgi:photosystem II stability/assembly factor-like uncharacterized protein
LYYGESTLEVSPDDDSLSVSIGTVLQVLTWTERTNAGSHHWLSIASSSKGDKLAAVEIADDSSSAHTYTSSDYGETWMEHKTDKDDMGHDWYSIASSADGTKLTAVDYNGYIYTSPDSGVTWTQQTNAGSRYWQAIVSSADGRKLAACADQEFIYTASF